MRRSAEVSSFNLMYTLCMYYEKQKSYDKTELTFQPTLVTIISEQLFEKLSPRPNCLREIKMYAAGKDQTLTAKVVGPVEVEIGEQKLYVLVHMAKIFDNMLLGIDLLRKLNAFIDVAKGEITTQIHAIPVISNKIWDPGLTSSAEVILPRAERLSALSETVIQVEVDSIPGSPFMRLEPNNDLPVLVPHTVLSTSLHLKICLVNTSTTDITLKKGTVLGKIHPVGSEDIIDKRESDTSINSVTKTLDNQEIPHILKDLWVRASAQLKEEEAIKLKNLLCEFQDVFADSEFDLGNFTAIEHTIDTGDEQPIKLGLRRTPVHFASEEDALLEKMLASGVIQPSMSSWAAAPVLVRKKDGKVRWCIDYRTLNNVTVKDVFPLPLMSECIDSLEGNVWFSKLDANAAYWQIPVHKDSKAKTAFRTRHGLL